MDEKSSLKLLVMEKKLCEILATFSRRESEKARKTKNSHLLDL